MLLRQHRQNRDLHATIDARLQRVLERHVRRYVERQRRFGIENASAMFLDFRSMEVGAVVGSANFLDPRIGKAKPRTSYAWTPAGPGAYTVRVVDDQGRSDSRQLRVSVSN